MRQENHYEQAFLAYLKTKNIPYTATNETHRTTFKNAGLKSFDFIIYPPKQKLIVDIKGRKAKAGKNSIIYDPWIPEEDISALQSWQEIFGNSFKTCFVFSFLLPPSFSSSPLIFEHKGKPYEFRAIYLDDYTPYLKTRSQKWKTKTIPTKIFHQLSWYV